MMIEGAAALGVGAVACVTDLRTRRIPNWLTFGAAGAAFLFASFHSGFSGLGNAALGWLVGVILFLPLFVIGGMGGGDVKLMGAIGAWLGVWPVVHVAFYAAITGGVMGIIVALSQGYVRTLFANLRTMFSYWFYGLGHVPGMTIAESTAPKLAYALPIAAGTILTLWLK